MAEIHARTFVRPEGNPRTARIAIVGEQPGTTEIQSGRPFVGPAGRELTEDLQAVGLTRQDCYLTNFAKDLDAPVEQYLNLKTMTFNERGLAYKSLLLQELNQLNSRVIVACGNYAMAALVQRTSVTKWRGSILTSPDVPDKWVIPMLHPATVIPPKNQYLNKFLIQFDLRRALDVAERGFGPIPRRILSGLSHTENMTWLERFYQWGLEGETVYFDIEIYNEEVSCISFARNESFAISIPFVTGEGNYFSPNQELSIWLGIAKILENPDIVKCGQNVGFDTHFLLRRYGIAAVNLEDTMVAQRIIMPDYPIGLDFITSVWTDHPYYKDEGKKYFGGGGWKQLWAYNATDSLICAEAFPKQLERLSQQRNLSTYHRQRGIVPPLVYMQERGIKVDVEGMKAKYNELNQELVVKQEELNKEAGFPLNANSPKQLQQYFYGSLNHKAYTSRKTGTPTTDDLAMTRLARKGIKAASIVKEIRKIRKVMGTYVPIDDEGNLTKIDPDGRVRCSFNPAGTKFSRISSSENIFGTGMNLQNIPHNLLKYFLFDEGYVGYAIDLSQAENRVVAYLANITPMIEAFESGKDVHKLTASLIFQKPIDKIITENDMNNGAPPCPLGDGTHDERFWGKKANHGLNYDLGYVTFSLYYEMPETQARWVVERYHMAYPGVRNNFHAMVKKMLQSGRVVTNLMGRHTLFMGRWDDKLFKEAYSCIPQGTVGDVINERSVNFLYYQQDKFSSVELLLQKHDEVVFQIPRSVPLIQHAEILLDLKSSLETPLVTLDGREFVIPADISVCPRSFSKKDATELKSHKVPKTPELLAERLKEILEPKCDETKSP